MTEAAGKSACSSTGDDCVESSKKLCIRKKNGCIQEIPLYTDKTDLQDLNGLVITSNGKKFYADIVDMKDPYASALKCRKHFVERSVRKKTEASEPDVLHLKDTRRIVKNSDELTEKIGAQVDAITKSIRSATDGNAKRKLKQDLDEVNKAAICVQFKNTLYHQPLESIPNVLDASDLKTTSYMYYGCKELKMVDAIDTSSSSDMRSMFEGCVSLPSILPYIIDIKSVTDVAMLHDMFKNSSVKKAYCKNADDSVAQILGVAKRKIGAQMIASVPLNQNRYKMADLHPDDYQTTESFKESYCCIGMKSLESMYNGCAAMKEAQHLDTGWIEDFRNMYMGCKSLPEEFPFLIDISAVKDPKMLRGMFKGSSVKVVQFATENQKVMNAITPELLGTALVVRQAIVLTDTFHKMKDIAPDYYRSMKKPYAFFKVGDGFNDASEMFKGCAGLETVDDGSLEGVHGITNTKSMFQGCKSLKKIPGIKSTESLDTSFMFDGCESITDIPITLSTHEANTMESMFRGCKSLPKVLDWILDANSVGYANGFDHMFEGTPVEEISVANLDRSVRKDMVLKDIGENIKKVKLYGSINWINADSDLRYKENHERIVIWNDAQLEDLVGLKTVHELRFYGLTFLDDSIGNASELVSIDKITGTEIAKSMRGMFSRCKKLSSVPAFSLAACEDASQLFKNCAVLSGIPELDLSHVPNMKEMFYGCRMFPADFPWVIDLSSVKDADSIKNMFLCSSVRNVKFKNARADVQKNVTLELLGISSEGKVEFADASSEQENENA